MSTPDYRPVSLDMAVARTQTPVVEVGTKINHVAIISVPAGSNALLHIGNKEGIPIVAGDSWDIWADGPDNCPVAHDEGLFVTNPSGSGSLQLVISFGNVGIAR